MTGCTSTLISTNLYTYCTDFQYVPVSFNPLYLLIILISGVVLMWKGIKVTTLPLLLIFVAINMVIFAERISANSVNIPLYDIRSYYTYVVYNTSNNSVITSSTGNTLHVTVNVPLFLILLNFFGTLLYASRHYLNNKIQSYI